MKNNYVSGDWNIHCMVCSKKIKASESKKRWDGLIVCKEDFEFRHPMDFLRAKVDKIAVPFIRKEPSDLFVSTGDEEQTINGYEINGTEIN